MSEFEIVTTKDFVDEIRNFQFFHKKHGEISTPVSFVSSYEEPLNEFDRAVLSVCTSEFLIGNICTTPSVIFRALIGKVGECDKEPSKNQKSAIIESTSKSLATVVKFDTTQSFQKLNYEEAKIVELAVLPCCHIQAKINGQIADVIRFDRISPFYDMADPKNKIVRYPISLLDVPNPNNTPLIISLKTYVMRRVAEIKAHKMTPTITFEDVFEKCRLDGADRKTKFYARESVLQLFKHLFNKKYVVNFEIERRGVPIYAITFSYITKRKFD